MYDPGALYVDPILTDFSVGFKDQSLYGLRLFPETPVRTPSGKYRVYDRSDWLIHRSLRAPNTVANEVGAKKWSEDVFSTKEHALQAVITDEERKELVSQGGLANAVFGGDLQIDPERDATDYVTRSLMLEHEKRVADAIRDTGNYPGGSTLDLAGSTQWDDYTGGEASDSDPVANIKLAMQKVHLSTGRWPNTFTIPWDAVGIIENHPRVVARYKYTSVTNPDAWQALLGLPAEATAGLRVFVVDSMYNAADNVDVAEDITSFWGQDVWLGIVDETPGQKTKTFGKTFAEVYLDGSVRPTERWREENRKVDVVRTNWKYDLKIVSPTAGYLWTNVVTAVS